MKSTNLWKLSYGLDGFLRVVVAKKSYRFVKTQCSIFLTFYLVTICKKTDVCETPCTLLLELFFDKKDVEILKRLVFMFITTPWWWRCNKQKTRVFSEFQRVFYQRTTLGKGHHDKMFVNAHAAYISLIWHKAFKIGDKLDFPWKSDHCGLKL